MPAVPKDTVEIVNRLVRASRLKRRATGREPTLEELAQELAIPLETARRAIEIAQGRIRL